jgi:hypothetical protein
MWRLNEGDDADCSPRNFRYMRAFAEALPEPEILQSLIAKLPWGHNLRVRTGSRIVPPGSGTYGQRSNTARVRMSWFFRSRAAYTRRKGRH